MLGELHFGTYAPNLTAHEAIVDRGVWERVQRMTVSAGRRAKSDRVLARVGVLRCGGCGGRMVVGSARSGAYALYRCPPHSTCEQRFTIGAEIVERVVVDAVRAALSDVEGRASAEHRARDASVALDRAQAQLDAAIRAFSGLEDETAAKDRLIHLRQERDEAREHVERLGGTRSALTISAATDWDRLSLDARRALTRAVVERVTVAPGRGPGRITVALFAE